MSWPEGILCEVPIGFGDSIVCEAVVTGVDKEGTHVVMLSANLEFAIWDVDSVLSLDRMMLEDGSVLVCIERVPDLLFFTKERVLCKCFEVALAPSGFLGFVPDKVGFIQGVIILYVLVILVTPDTLVYTFDHSRSRGLGGINHRSN